MRAPARGGRADRGGPGSSFSVCVLQRGKEVTEASGGALKSPPIDAREPLRNIRPKTSMRSRQVAVSSPWPSCRVLYWKAHLGILEGMQADQLREKAVEVFGSRAAAGRWFRKPAIGLNRQRPVDLLVSAEGRELVSTYLDQIETGVYV